jgi:hypothetical protein
MSMKRRVKILTTVLGAVIILTVVLLAAVLFPALNRMRLAREEHRQIEREIQRALLEVRLNRLEASGEAEEEVPELPEIAACVTSLLGAEAGSGIRDLRFESVRTDKQEFLAAGLSDRARTYLVSRVHVDFSSDLLAAARFLEMTRSDGPEEAFDYISISRRTPGEDMVDVSMIFRLYGVPR